MRIEGGHFILPMSGVEARIPVLAFTHARVVSGHSGGELELKLWDGDVHTVPVPAADAVEAARALEDQVALNQIRFPLSAARAQSVRLLIQPGDVPAALPLVSDKFREEFLTPLDRHPRDLIDAVREHMPRVGKVLDLVPARERKFIVIGDRGLALASPGAEHGWSITSFEYAQMELPTSRIIDDGYKCIELGFEELDGAIGTALLPVDFLGPLSDVFLFVSDRVLAARLPGDDGDVVSRLEWANERKAEGMLDDALLALVVTRIVSPGEPVQFPPKRPQYGSPKPPPLAPQSTRTSHGQQAARQPTLQERFEAAVDIVKNLEKVPRDDQIQLVALFKQATDGDAMGSRPDSDRGQWDAWAKLRGIPQGTAKTHFVQLVDRIVAQKALGTGSAKGGGPSAAQQVRTVGLLAGLAGSFLDE